MRSIAAQPASDQMDNVRSHLRLSQFKYGFRLSVEARLNFETAGIEIIRDIRSYQLDLRSAHPIVRSSHRSLRTRMCLVRVLR